MQIDYTTSNFKGGIYRAVLAILLGLALLIWPADALKYVVMLIGIVFLAIGIIAFIISSRNREEHQRSFAPLSGIGSVILGLLLVSLLLRPFLCFSWDLFWWSLLSDNL